MNEFNRIFLVVLDSVGIGEAPDAKEYGDLGADTLGHISEKMSSFQMPHASELGLGNIRELKGVQAVPQAKAHFTKMQEASVGKDTMTGHWELMGLHIDTAFKTFPNGLTYAFIKELEMRRRRKVIGNKPASGTVIIEELGKEHIETGNIIVYTSADSVLQIAAHEDIVPIDELYNICEIARELT